MDQDLRQLQRQADAGDTSAMLQLYSGYQRAGNMDAAVRIAFRRAVALGISDSLADLFAVLRLEPAVEYYRQRHKKSPLSRLTIKLIKELGQEVGVKLSAALLGYRARQFLQRSNLSELPANLATILQTATEHLWKWKTAQKLDPKYRKMIVDVEKELSKTYPELDWRYLSLGPAGADFTNQHEIGQLFYIIASLDLAYQGRLKHPAIILTQNFSSKYI